MTTTTATASTAWCQLQHLRLFQVRRADIECFARDLEARGRADEHALISLLALNGLRVSEATGANIESLGVERGHRTLVITRKGGKIVTIPLAPHRPGRRPGHRRTAEGPIFLTPDGRRLDRHATYIVAAYVAGAAR